jgi:hypothetical protein
MDCFARVKKHLADHDSPSRTDAGLRLRVERLTGFLCSQFLH